MKASSNRLERCGHGLTSRPGESASVPCLNELSRLFGYPSGSAGALLAGTFLLRYCTTRFASGIPTWRLLVPGHVASLVTVGVEVPGAPGIGVSCQGFHCVGEFGPVRKRI